MLVEPKEMDNYYPFSVLHPLWEIRYGAFKAYDKVSQEFPNMPIYYRGRKKQTDLFLKKHRIKDKKISRGTTLVLSSNIVIGPSFWEEFTAAVLKFPKTTILFLKDDKPVAAYLHVKNFVENLDEKDFTNLNSMFLGNFQKVELEDSRTFSYIHELIYLNGDSIAYDSSFVTQYNKLVDLNYPGVHQVRKSKEIKIGKNVKIAPGVVLDSTSGPILIGENVVIMPQATIIGPCFIGKNSVIKVGAKIYGNTSIGEYCKVGGEVEDVIFQSYSNKQHDGFLGHSFIGEWVNLGADTNNSDLKNTYGPIKLRFKGKTVNTGETFLGLICGDHTKTAINTRFNTGTVCGVAANIFTADFPPTTIPSFSWGGGKDSKKYNIDDALETAEKVMKRRAKKLLPEEAELLREEYSND